MRDPQIDEMLAEFGGEPGSSVGPIGNGLIHDTYVVSNDGKPAFVLQRLNTTVFPDPELLLDNANVVTDRIRTAVAARGGDTAREVLKFLPARDGRFFARDSTGTYWRMSRFVANSFTVDIATNEREAAMFAEAFARFHRDIWDVPIEKVRDAIPGFHDTPRRYQRFCEVSDQAGAASRELADRFERAGECIRQIHDRADALGTIERDRVSRRISTHVCHNDTKVNNVLLDRFSNRPLCVIDFDTVGRGTPLMDVGDLLRTAAASESEEEQDHAKVFLDLKSAEAIVEAFSEGLGDLLNDRERELLPMSGWVITVEQAIRYLTDYLEGDVYYGARYPEQNLSKTRNQLALLRSMEEQFVEVSV